MVGVCLEGSCLGSEKHHRQLTGALRLSAGLPGICIQGSSRDCRQERVLRAPAPQPSTLGENTTPAIQPRERTV